MAEAQRILERKHGVNPQVVSWRQWRDAFIKHLSPEEAADHAVTAVHNAPDR